MSPESNNTARHDRNGVLAAGHWILDRVKVIDVYPPQEALASILEEFEGNGGCAYNLLKNLNLLGAGFPLEGVGVLGDDATGERIRADAALHGIDTKGLRTHPEAPSSYTDVMSVRKTGKRTFFHQRGANALLSEEDVLLSRSRARHFHLGYLGLLDALEHMDADGRTQCSRLFETARSFGFVTSADMVSSEAPDLPAIVRSSLPHLDYLLLNEFEAARLTGMRSVDTKEGEVCVDTLEMQAEKILGGGVNRAVVIHFAGGAVYRDAAGSVFRQGAVRFPSDRIAGSAGAGDAFAAGFLFGVHDGWTTSASLELAVCSAAVSLESPTCSGAIRPWEECLSIGRGYRFREM